MVGKLWLIAPLIIVVAVGLLLITAAFGLYLWRFLANLFSTWTGGYCPHPLC